MATTPLLERGAVPTTTTHRRAEMANPKATCSIDGCDVPIRCRGLCPLHYERWRAHGPDRPLCAIPECETTASTAGWCPKHYYHARRYGDPLAGQMVRGDDLTRFESYINRLPNGCWEWTGFCWDSGYGRTSVGSRSSMRAHRAVYELLGGPIPEGMTLDHECHNEAAGRGECAGGPACPHRRCVNPAHLTVKSIRDNQMASANASAHKTHCVHGHEYTPESTRYNNRGTRWCLICKRETNRKNRDRTRPNRVRRPNRLRS